MVETHADTVLAARDVHKTFGRVEALRGADFDVRRAEVVALMGDNGAGKSTLVKVLSGVVRPDSGDVFVDGTRVDIGSPQDARDAGIETVYQDLALADTLDPSANLFLGREVRRPGLLGMLGFLDNRAMRERAAEVFRSLEVTLRSERDPVGNMSGGQRQGIAVSRAATWAQHVLFLDEPTAALGVRQTRTVLDLVRRVRDRGIAVVLISHSLPEVMAVADRIQVMRLGTRVGEFLVPDTTAEQVVAAMTGAGEAGLLDGPDGDRG